MAAVAVCKHREAAPAGLLPSQHQTDETAGQTGKKELHYRLSAADNKRKNVQIQYTVHNIHHSLKRSTSTSGSPSSSSSGSRPIWAEDTLSPEEVRPSLRISDAKEMEDVGLLRMCVLESEQQRPLGALRLTASARQQPERLWLPSPWEGVRREGGKEKASLRLFTFRQPRMSHNLRYESPP
ncbi:hypothetical protein Q8A73_002130 [Channa argus]|nr:hypothetical protein Q8A73_002130 [Channa argus]